MPNKGGGKDCWSCDQQNLAGHVGVREAFGQNGRGGSHDQGDGEDELLHGGISYDRGVGRLAGHVGVREALGHDRRGRGDDERNGEDQLLHNGSPLGSGRLI